MIERNEQALEYVRLRLVAVKEKLCTTCDHIFAMRDVMRERVLEVEHHRPALDEGDHVDAEGVLQARVLEQLVDDNLFLLAALQGDNQAQPVSVAFVAEVGDAGDGSGLDQLCDAAQDPVGIVRVGDLGEDNVRTSGLGCLTYSMSFLRYWSPLSDSNRGQSAYKAEALSTELSGLVALTVCVSLSAVVSSTSSVLAFIRRKLHRTISTNAA